MNEEQKITPELAILLKEIKEKIIDQNPEFKKKLKQLFDKFHSEIKENTDENGDLEFHDEVEPFEKTITD